MLHHPPHFGKIFPNVGSFALSHIFPIGVSRPVAPVKNIANLIHVVDIGRLLFVKLLVGECSAANTVNRPFVQFRAVAVNSFKMHTVRMERKKHLRFPLDIDRCGNRKRIVNGTVSQVAFSRSRQTAVERHIEMVDRFFAHPFQKHLRRTHRPHRMAARRSVTDSIYLSDRFHCIFNFS